VRVSRTVAKSVLNVSICGIMKGEECASLRQLLLVLDAYTVMIMSFDNCASSSYMPRRSVFTLYPHIYSPVVILVLLIVFSHS
jgi:hypothetical protein